ncbi:MAG: tRNA (adenine-N1)-methyltransferase [Promethearchaeati archaeon SRVP18_Atabeyarchaeia-1]
MREDNIIHGGDYALVVLDDKRRWIVKVEPGGQLHTHRGIIRHDDLLGKEFGIIVESTENKEFLVFKPTIPDFALLKLARSTQIVYPKDSALILVQCGLGPGSRIVEAGTGSASLTAMLANSVRPTGFVYSYELRNEFINSARKNLELCGVSNWVEIKNKDVTQGIEEKDADAVILDLATPWLVVSHAREALKGSGIISSYSPTIEQTQKTVLALKESLFEDIQTYECLVRKILVREGKTRPETFMVGHTGYITFARKLLEGSRATAHTISQPSPPPA